MYGYHKASLKAAQYGSLPDPESNHDEKIHTQHHGGRKFNPRAVFLCWLIPSAIFTLVAGLLSSTLQDTQTLLTTLVLAIVVANVLLIAGLGAHMIGRYLRGRLQEFPFWYSFFVVASLASLIVAVWFAQVNYVDNTSAYENLFKLAAASNLDPATDSSVRFMDVGRVTFSNGSTVDTSKTIGFKNSDVYCVAPIVNSKSTVQPKTFDYWAIGLNCCSLGTFSCGAYDNPAARSGIRLLREDQRAFYKLAAEEAEVTYGVKMEHPIFFYWVEDATEASQGFVVAATKYWLIASAAWACFLMASTVTAAMFYMKFLVKV